MMPSKLSLLVALIVGCAIGGSIIIGAHIVSQQGHQTEATANLTAITSRLRSIAAQNSILTKRLATDEHAACVIQARGLPADHELAKSFGVFHKLLTTILGQVAHASPRKQTPEQMREGREDLALVARLNHHLGAFSRAEAKQPATRTCS